MPRTRDLRGLQAEPWYCAGPTDAGVGVCPNEIVLEWGVHHKNCGPMYADVVIWEGRNPGLLDDFSGRNG
jgi:hypothetical protein